MNYALLTVQIAAALIAASRGWGIAPISLILILFSMGDGDILWFKVSLEAANLIDYISAGVLIAMAAVPLPKVDPEKE